MQNKILQDGLNECSNFDYHSDRKYLSSSVLKTIYKSLDDYKHEYLDGNKKQFGNENALLEGSLTHSMLLEPHQVSNDYIFFDGLRKAGNQWENFVAEIRSEDVGKPIVSRPQKLRVQSYIEAFKRRPEAVQMLTGGQAEQTICGTLNGVPIKVRFDYINVERGEVYDIKTTGKPADPENFKATVNGLSYQLSAALYCAMAEQFYGKKFRFVFLVISKQEPIDCQIYRASESTMAEGRRMVDVACAKYLKALETGNWCEPEEASVSETSSVSHYEILEI